MNDEAHHGRGAESAQCDVGQPLDLMAQTPSPHDDSTVKASESCERYSLKDPQHQRGPLVPLETPFRSARQNEEGGVYT